MATRRLAIGLPFSSVVSDGIIHVPAAVRHLCLGSRLLDKRMCVTHYSLSLRLRPSAPERTIQFHDRGELLALQRREIEFAP